MTLSFYATGDPKAQPRARATIRGKHAGLWTPETAKGWKESVRFAAYDAWQKIGKPVFQGPIRVDAHFNFPRPKSHFGTGKNAGNVKSTAPNHHFIKPDRDNLDKALLDALTVLGIWKDDCQVCAGEIQKTYAIGDYAGGVSVTVTQL